MPSMLENNPETARNGKDYAVTPMRVLVVEDDPFTLTILQNG